MILPTSPASFTTGHADRDLLVGVPQSISITLVEVARRLSRSPGTVAVGRLAIDSRSLSASSSLVLDDARCLGRDLVAALLSTLLLEALRSRRSGRRTR